jgi:hypothetical protein
VDFGFDWRVFGYAMAAALFTGAIVGLWPALRAGRADVNSVLQSGGRSDTAGAGRHRLRSVLVVAQVAGSLVLLIVAGLFVRSLMRAQHAYMGFDANHVLNLTLDPREVGYDETRTKTFYHDLEAKVRALPGVQSASLAFSVPMGPVQDGSLIRRTTTHSRPTGADRDLQPCGRTLFRHDANSAPARAAVSGK